MLGWLTSSHRSLGAINRFGSNRADLNRSPARLRDTASQGALGDVTKFRGGAVLRADPGIGLTGNYNSPKGRLLELDVSMKKTGSWVGLHLPIRLKDTSNNGVLGFSCIGYAPEVCALRVCLRSRFSENFVDCFFQKHVLLHEIDSMHVDAISLQPREHVPEICKRRELVVFLPSSPFRLSLIDFRVFAV